MVKAAATLSLIIQLPWNYAMTSADVEQQSKKDAINEVLKHVVQLC